MNGEAKLMRGRRNRFNDALILLVRAREAGKLTIINGYTERLRVSQQTDAPSRQRLSLARKLINRKHERVDIIENDRNETALTKPAST